MLPLFFLMFFVLLFGGVPIAVCLGAVGAVWLVSRPDIPIMLLATKTYAMTDNFAMLAIPFFMFSGQLMERTGITRKLVAFANSLVGSITGGLAHTATLSGMLMAGVSGSGNADTAAIGGIMIPALIEDGYEDGFSASVIAAAGALGPIIPPSTCMIVFANAANYSVGKVFMGGVVPGIIMGVLFMVICYIYAKSRGMKRSKFLGIRNIGKCFISAIGALIMPVIIIGGIISGICTATEAGCLASIYGILYAVFTKQFSIPMLKECLLGAAKAMIGPLMIITYSAIFGYMLTLEGTANMIKTFCVAHISNQYILMLFLLLICTIAGCFIDGLATMLMLLPVLSPVVNAMHIDFQYFALIFVLSILTCQITPPVGSLLYISAGINNTPVRAISKHIIPFCVVMIGVIVLCIFVPSLVTWLPNLIYS